MGCFGSTQKLSKSDLLFLIENTEFTKQQIEVWYSGFIVDCPSGELSKAKFIEVYQQLFPQGDAQKFCAHIFRTFDVDNSGKIDFKEFLMAINITAKGDPEKKLKWAFKMYDVNGDGEIDKTEMLQIIQSIYDLIGINLKSEKLIENGSAVKENNCLNLESINLNTNDNSININNDKNNNNNNNDNLNLNKNELDFSLDSQAESPLLRTEQIFQKMDMDKNGVITENEFINGCLQDKFLYQMLTADYSDSF